MPVIDGDLFSPRIRLTSICDVRTIKQLKSLFRNKKGIENKSRTLYINIVQP